MHGRLPVRVRSAAAPLSLAAERPAAVVPEQRYRPPLPSGSPPTPAPAAAPVRAAAPAPTAAPPPYGAAHADTPPKPAGVAGTAPAQPHDPWTGLPLPCCFFLTRLLGFSESPSNFFFISEALLLCVCVRACVYEASLVRQSFFQYHFLKMFF